MKSFFKLFLTLFLAVSFSSVYAVDYSWHKVESQVVLSQHNASAAVSVVQAQNDDEPVEGKSQLVALILALLVGAFGIHRFYLGYKKIGIIQLVLTLTGIFAVVSWVWSIIDAINIATGDLKPADGNDYEDKI